MVGELDSDGGAAECGGEMLRGAFELCPTVVAGAGLAAVLLVSLLHGPHINMAPMIANTAMTAAIVPGPMAPALRRSRSLSSLIFVLRCCNAKTIYEEKGSERRLPRWPQANLDAKEWANDRFGSIATESGLSDRFRSTPGNGHRRTASACRKSARRVGFVMVAVMSDPPSTDISGAGLEYLNLPGTDILRMGILAIVALLPAP